MSQHAEVAPGSRNRFTGKPVPPNAIEQAEDKAIRRANRIIPRLQARHPALFVLAAFVLGGVITSLFTIPSYGVWGTEHINVARAIWTVLLTPIAGGVLLAIVATVCARAMRR